MIQKICISIVYPKINCNGTVKRMYLIHACNNLDSNFAYSYLT